MSKEVDQRTRVASLLRELGHEFVSHELDNETLIRLATAVEGLLALVSSNPARIRGGSSGSLETFRSSIPVHGSGEPRHLFADSIVSGGSNPLGLGAYLWRDGDHAVMEVTLGPAFEGAPGRAHGGIVAALIDETMGLVLSIHGTMALTAQLDISYRAATPVNVPIMARAWLESQEGRKMRMRCEVSAGGDPLAEATSLFIAIDPSRFHATESPLA